MFQQLGVAGRGSRGRGLGHAQHVSGAQARQRGPAQHAARVGGGAHAHVALLAPRRRPRVLDDEVRLSAVHRPAHRQHGVVGAVPPAVTYRCHQLYGKGSTNLFFMLIFAFLLFQDIHYV